jgi:hypothetical protein
MMQHLFDCTVCERPVTDYNNRGGRDRSIAPICMYCEKTYGDRAPNAGAFMDRRIAVRLSAMANALRSTASMIEWGHRYGRS